MADEHDHLRGRFIAVARRRRRPGRRIRRGRRRAGMPLGALPVALGPQRGRATPTRWRTRGSTSTQLTELCTRYGELAELWFDGAGSEGYSYDWPAHHGRGRGRISRTRWSSTWEHPPSAGSATRTGWPATRSTTWSGRPSSVKYTVVSSELTEALYLPPECDVSVRRGWFWAASRRAEDGRPPARHLLPLGRPRGEPAAQRAAGPSGRIDPADAEVVRAFGAECGAGSGPGCPRGSRRSGRVLSPSKDGPEPVEDVS